MSKNRNQESTAVMDAEPIEPSEPTQNAPADIFVVAAGIDELRSCKPSTFVQAEDFNRTVECQTALAEKELHQLSRMPRHFGRDDQGKTIENETTNDRAERLRKIEERIKLSKDRKMVYDPRALREWLLCAVSREADLQRAIEATGQRYSALSRAHRLNALCMSERDEFVNLRDARKLIARHQFECNEHRENLRLIAPKRVSQHFAALQSAHDAIGRAAGAELIAPIVDDLKARVRAHLDKIADALASKSWDELEAMPLKFD